MCSLFQTNRIVARRVLVDFNNAVHRLANIAYTPNGRALIKEDFDKVYEDLKHERLKAFVLYPESYTSVAWTFSHFQIPSPVLKMLEQAFGASFNYNSCEPKMDENPKACTTPFAAPMRLNCSGSGPDLHFHSGEGLGRQISRNCEECKAR